MAGNDDALEVTRDPGRVIAAFAAAVQEHQAALEVFYDHQLAVSEAKTRLVDARDNVLGLYPNPKDLGANEDLREAKLRDLTINDVVAVHEAEKGLIRARSRMESTALEVSYYKAGLSVVAASLNNSPLMVVNGPLGTGPDPESREALFGDLEGDDCEQPL